MEAQFSKTNPNKLEVTFTKEEMYQISLIQQLVDSKDVSLVVKEYIDKQFQVVKEKSMGITVAELLAQKLDTIIKYNKLYNGKIYTEQEIQDIKSLNPANVILGLKVASPISNQLVMEYTEEFNVSVPPYKHLSSKRIPSYIINISTSVYDYVYIASINTIFSIDTYENYVK